MVIFYWKNKVCNAFFNFWVGYMHPCDVVFLFVISNKLLSNKFITNKVVTLNFLHLVCHILRCHFVLWGLCHTSAIACYLSGMSPYDYGQLGY